VGKTPVLLAAVVISFCVLSLPVLSAEKGAKDWRVRMGELSVALSEAIPLLYPDPGKDPKGLSAKVKKIYDITKDLDSGLNHDVSVPDADPALPYIANLLRLDIERAYTSLQEGHTDYAKSVLRSSVSYCIACHTRTEGGVEFPVLKAFEQPLKRASWIEKIEFQAASRQFDPVFSEVMGKLKSPGNLGVSPLDLERGARIALSIAVRVKKDPDRAALLTNAISGSANASLSMKEAAKTWLKDIRIWQGERGKKFAGDTELMQAARSLLQTDSDTKMGGHTEVRYLRASVLMHDLLKTNPKSPHTAEALYMIGRSYDYLRDLGLWSLHEMYFLACIDKAPHTELSEKCYKEYEDSITLGYSGSSGVHIPTPVRKHLANIKQKATVTKAAPKKGQ